VSVLEICRGLPASGKTTYAQARIASWPRGYVAMVSRDTIRREMFATHFQPDTQDFEDQVTLVQHAAIAALLRCVSLVICDDTNLHLDHVMALIGVAKQGYAGWKVIDFTSLPLGECIARDDRRPSDQRVGRERITEMFDKHIAEHYPRPLPVS
jgi:tRNA uridine 5-carbamoylmethylation protein Kti12